MITGSSSAVVPLMGGSGGCDDCGSSSNGGNGCDGCGRVSGGRERKGISRLYALSTTFC